MMDLSVFWDSARQLGRLMEVLTHRYWQSIGGCIARILIILSFNNFNRV